MTSSEHVTPVHAHIPKVGTLVGVWATLVVFTVITALVATVNLGEFNVVVALIIAVTKASLVAWIFMGVRHTTSLTKLFVVAGLVWLGIMILITASDYTSRTWTYQAQPWATNPAGGKSR
ncbi:MAG TPA: cytochrome C oxidase subunit IV family protein [Bryobacteraceae bacterium]|jgi:cytochrome c oxidase subunit 4